MLDAPPSKKRPDWKAETIVDPDANVSGSTCVLCWLEGFVYGSELIFVSGTAADAEATSSTRTTEISESETADRRACDPTVPLSLGTRKLRLQTRRAAIGGVSASDCGYGIVSTVRAATPAIPDPRARTQKASEEAPPRTG